MPSQLQHSTPTRFGPKDSLQFTLDFIERIKKGDTHRPLAENIIRDSLHTFYKVANHARRIANTYGIDSGPIVDVVFCLRDEIPLSNDLLEAFNQVSDQIVALPIPENNRNGTDDAKAETMKFIQTLMTEGGLADAVRGIIRSEIDKISRLENAGTKGRSPDDGDYIPASKALELHGVPKNRLSEAANEDPPRVRSKEAPPGMRDELGHKVLRHYHRRDVEKLARWIAGIGFRRIPKRDFFSRFCAHRHGIAGISAMPNSTGNSSPKLASVRNAVGRCRRESLLWNWRMYARLRNA